jgi:Tol biopolymer transport system component
MGTRGLPPPLTAIAVALLVPLATLAIVACGSGGPPKATTPLPTPTVTGTIAFERVVEPYVDSDIYVVNTDGSGLKRLTDDPGWEEHPSWSPDGSKIAWVVGRVMPGFATALPRGGAIDPKIWVMNADGSGKVQLTRGPVRGVQPTWSPDGKQIAFAAPNGDGFSVVDADGTGLRRVTSNGGHPAWAPDGEIVFLGSVERSPVNSDVFAVKPDGSGLRKLTKGWDVTDFGLSPDGRWLAIHDARSDRVVAVPTQPGGAPVTLLAGVSDYVRVEPLNAYVASAWSPDGKALALATSDTWGIKGSRVYIVNADGSGLTAIPGVDKAIAPAWRPQ